MIKVGLIGCGNIGTELAVFIDKNKNFNLNSLTDIEEDNIERILKKIKSNPKIFSLERAIRNSDLIIEAANNDVVKKILQQKSLDNKGKKILVMSSGGLFENKNLLKKIMFCEIHVPSGAIAGLDAIKAVSENIQSLELKTTKPVNGLMNAPFVLKNNMNLNLLVQQEKIFEGNLREAILGFPQNINVAASLYLASSFEQLKISIYADPATQFNTHEITCKGSFGFISATTKNFPSTNPKTSYLAILSALSVLKNMTENLKSGN